MMRPLRSRCKHSSSRLAIEALEDRLQLSGAAVVETLRFAAIADYGGNNANEQAVADMVHGWNPDFVTTIGDNNYGTDSQIDTYIGKYYHDFIGDYKGTFLPGSATNRFFPALGNADWKTGTGASAYVNYFTLPGNERYYDYVQGPVHFFVVDSDPHEPDGRTSDSVQAQWLHTALSSSTSEFNLVYFHHPAYSSGNSHGSDPDMQWPFKEWGADAVMMGHDHDYERMNVDGLPFFVDGVGGRSLNIAPYFISPPLSESQFRMGSAYGAMLMTATTTASESSLQFEFYTVDNGSVPKDSYTITHQLAQPSSVVGRQVFYNTSKFDSNDPAATPQDDAAIAPDKRALLPGSTATFANYTSYTRGINGLMVDIAGLPGAPTASDFDFRVGNSNDPASWVAAPAPASVSVRPGAGTDGSDRVTIIWPDRAIQKQWLQVTVKPTSATGLAAPDVFYFGNAVGEAGNSTTNALVGAGDEIAARNAPRNILNPAPIDFPYDFNRDSFVNAQDQISARNNGTNVQTALRLISVPAAQAASSEQIQLRLPEYGLDRLLAAAPQSAFLQREVRRLVKHRHVGVLARAVDEVFTQWEIDKGIAGLPRRPRPAAKPAITTET